MSTTLSIVWRTSTRSPNEGGQCVEVGAWRKSSRSQSNAGQCVEVGAWRKSSRSNSGGGQCVEAGTCSCHGIAVRDSKAPALGSLPLTLADWTALLTTVKTDTLG